MYENANKYNTKSVKICPVDSVAVTTGLQGHLEITC